jgi:hypothetical protein
MQNPANAFDRIFGGAIGEPSALAELRRRRQSVLDTVTGDYERLQRRLGAEDRARIDAHLTALRDVERAVTALDDGPTCTIPGRPASTSRFVEVVAANMRLGVLAMACELTPVVTFQWSTGESDLAFDWLGHSRNHHTISHDADTNATSQDQLVAINRWYASRFADLLAAMSEAREGDGSRLLDHAAVLWANELGKGNNHSFQDIPYVLAGGAGGAIRGGRYLHYPSAPHGDLFVSIMQALGLDDRTFGAPEHVRGPLAGLAT